MKIIKQVTLIPILGILMLFFTVSCSSAQLTESAVVQPTSTPILPSTSQVVEYGASLDEWDEALDGNSATASTSSEVEVSSSVNSTDVAATATSQVTTGADTAVSTPIVSEYTLSDVIYQEILWDALVSPDFTAEVIMAKYEDELDEFEDGSPEAYDLYTQMQEEFNNAPINEALSETLVKIPGFIAPLNYSDELITEFLLVPYFGACIHVPPPPANQTILVTTSEEYGIKSEDSYNPVWILGKLVTDGATTDLAEAGYVIQNAIVEPYNGPN